MHRAPIVLTATVAGTAGVLAFHAHSSSVQAATASTATTTKSTTSTTPSSNGSGSSGKSSAVSGTATGDAISTPYGDAQVRVTVRNGRIVSVKALQLQGNDPRSVEISSSAEPILQQEALKAQSANIDVVSGASFTSESYIQSLQSALDKLGF